MKQAILKARGLCDRSKAASLLCNLLSYVIDIAGILEIYFAMLMIRYCLTTVVYSAYEYQITRTVSLLVKRFVGVQLDLVHCGWYCRRPYRIVAVHASNDQTGRFYYLWRLGSVPDEFVALTINRGLEWYHGHTIYWVEELGSGNSGVRSWLAILVSSIDTR